MFPPRGLTQAAISTLLVIVSSAALMVRSDCPAHCSCAATPPPCPPGVSWVTDTCGCCKVCAKQFNEDCNPHQPCDHIRGLQCQLGAGGDPERGLCRAQAQGRPCDFNGRVHQHGEDFQPSCQHQCSCMDGVVGCMPLCPHQVPLPNWPCVRPRLVRPAGSCCEQWLCDDSNHISEHREELSYTPQPEQALPNHISNELQTQTRHLVRTEDTVQGRMPVPSSHEPLISRCFPQTTDWTECSTTCGMGISSRVTNSNPECQLVRETRLCQIRQCDFLVSSNAKMGQKCQRTVRPREPLHIQFAGCSSTRRYRPRWCGGGRCCGGGHCCVPLLTRTVRLRFRCPDGESFSRSVMWIQRCHCLRPPSPFSLHNDIHTLSPDP